MSRGSSTSPREEYLARLEDLLPSGEVARVRMEVESMILDRAADEGEQDPALSPAEAEERAIRALGSPERLAEEIAGPGMTVSLAAQRTFVRLLAAVFACHLLLSIALTVMGSTDAMIPGLLGPLPKEPFAHVLLSVLSVFLIDAGALLLLFVATGRTSSRRSMPGLFRGSRWTRRGAIEGLVLLTLLAVLFNVYLERIFSVRLGETWQPFLAREFLAIVPYVNVVFALFGLRHVLTLLGRGNGALALFVDALGSLAGCVWFVVAATRSELVQLPSGHKLGREAADVLDNLIESVFLIVFVVGALLLVLRFVRQAIAAWRMLRT